MPHRDWTSRSSTKIRRRLLATAAAIVAVASGLGDVAGAARANTGAPRVIGGTPVAIQAAPWSAYLALANPISSCGGSILDATHVLTAAHCVVPEGTGRVRQPAEIDVLAGASNVQAWTPVQPVPAGAQARAVSAVRVHPYYDAKSRSDDAAVLTLAQPLNLSTPQVKPLALAPVGGAAAPGTAVRTIGYGQQSNAQPPDGRLYAAALTVGSDDSCRSLMGRNSAVMVCASSPTATPCHGDSGSALVSAAAPFQVGLVSGGLDPCGASPAVFADVSAPEIRAFVAGAPTIPIAPRQIAPTVLRGVRVPVNGSRLTCEPGAWSGAPSLAYAFQTDSPTPQVLQSGSSNVFAVPRTAIGQPIVCLVLATNAGGTATERTGTTPPIAADTVAPVWRVAARRCVRRRCQLAIQARDPNSDGPIAISVTATYRVHKRCKHVRGRHKSGHRSRCTATRSRPLTVAAIDGIDFRAASRRLPYARVSFAVRVVDAAGNGRMRKGLAPTTIKRARGHRRR